MRNPILVVAEKWRGWSKVQRGLVVVLAVGLCVVFVGNRPMAMMAPKDKAVSAYPPVDYRFNFPVASEPESMTVIDEDDRKQLQAAAAKTKEELLKNLDRLESTRATSEPLIAHLSPRAPEQWGPRMWELRLSMPADSGERLEGSISCRISVPAS